MAIIDEAAQAIAAGLCLAARAVDGRYRRTRRHPRRCTWCAWPTPELQRMVDGWNEWAGWNEKRGTYDRHEARVFQALPRTEQLAAVEAAQGLEPEHTASEEPMPVLAEPSADAEEESVSWIP